MNGVSCVMLSTAARARLRPVAVRCFLRQMLAPEHELVIVCEDEISHAELDSYGLLVRWVQPRAGIPIGEKRNLGVAKARYSWVTFWDDDDWSSQMRLHETARAISADCRIVGQPWMYFHELCSERRYTYLYRYPKSDYVIDGLMTFQKTLWNEHPLDDKADDEHGWMMGRWVLERLREYPNYGATNFLYIAMIHGNNTSNHALPRVDESDPQKRVLSDSYMRWLGGRSAAHGLAGASLEKFEEAVR